MDLWGAEIKGKRGYIPKRLVREYKILNKPKKLVDTKPLQILQVPTISEDSVQPDKTQKAYEIIDGTKVYYSPENNEKSNTQGKE